MLVSFNPAVKCLHCPADTPEPIVVQKEMDGTHLSAKLPKTRCSCKSRLLSRFPVNPDEKAILAVD